MIGRRPWLWTARLSDCRPRRYRMTLGEWLCSKGWHSWRRVFGGWAYGVGQTHHYRVRAWECRRWNLKNGFHCRAQFSGPPQILEPHDGL